MAIRILDHSWRIPTWSHLLWINGVWKKVTKKFAFEIISQSIDQTWANMIETNLNLLYSYASGKIGLEFQEKVMGSIMGR